MKTAENPMQKIIARCWEDEEFKKRLIADPAKILDAEGVSVPDGVSIRVVEDTEQIRTLMSVIRMGTLSISIRASAIMWQTARLSAPCSVPMAMGFLSMP